MAMCEIISSWCGRYTSGLRKIQSEDQCRPHCVTRRARKRAAWEMGSRGQGEEDGDALLGMARDDLRSSHINQELSPSR